MVGISSVTLHYVQGSMGKIRLETLGVSMCQNQ